MGIDKFRFTETISIAEFFCGMCGDVVDDPILTKECEHFLCRSCVAADMKICPTCGMEVNGCDEFGVALRRLYSNIHLRCFYISCEESLTIETYQAHERRCPHGFYECANACGFRLLLSLDESQRAHNCIEILQRKVVVLEASRVDLQSINDELNVKIEKLQTENADLLSAIVSQKKRRVTCGAVLQKGEIFYRCYTCQKRQMSENCVNCFQNGHHENHSYVQMVAEAGTWYCDCGGKFMLQKSSACSEHGVQ